MLARFYFAQNDTARSIEYVKAKEYVLIDPDMLSKQYSYSKENPLYIVMEKPGTQAEDKLAVERKIRRNLEKMLQQRENEIEQLKEENKISQQKYQQRSQELYASQEKNEKLISDMANVFMRVFYQPKFDVFKFLSCTCGQDEGNHQGATHSQSSFLGDVTVKYPIKASGFVS